MVFFVRNAILMFVSLKSFAISFVSFTFCCFVSLACIFVVVIFIFWMSYISVFVVLWKRNKINRKTSVKVQTHLNPCFQCLET
jgi:hypothetical protein